MNIELFNFTKRTNSTLRPTTGGTTKSVRLKEKTDVLNPIFIMDGIDLTSTMCIWNGAYYFITNRVFLTNNMMELHCKIDAGGTASDDIKAYTCFVERAASSYDTMLNDGLLSTQQDIVNRAISKTPITGDLLNPFYDVNGCYVVRTISQSTNSLSGINVYALSGSDLAGLLNYMFDDTNYSWLQQAQNEFIKSVFNPFDYIVDVKWVPFNIATVSTAASSEKIKLGWWETSAFGWPVNHTGLFRVFTLTWPTEYYTDFRQYSNEYTRISIMLPFVGVIDIDPLELSSGDTITVGYAVDFVTYTGHCYIMAVNTNTGIQKYLGYYNASYAAQIQLAQTSTDLKRMTGDLVAGVGNLFAGNVAGGVAGLVDMASCATSPSKSMIGGQSSITDLKATQNIQVTIESFGTKDFPTSVAGRPLMKNVQLGTLSGFVKCGNASLPLANSGIRDEVNSMLNSGIYIE